MPFTPSHAVVALAFVRTPLVPAAVAIGAMTPDLPLFTRGLPMGYGRTHDLAWLPVTTALALVLLLVWRCVLRPASRELAPRFIADRLPDSWDRGAADGIRETFGLPTRRPAAGDRTGNRWSIWMLLAVSLVGGVVSHIVWDLFTHEGRWGIALLPVLDQQWGPLAGYKWLQHGSSAAGLIILTVWMILALRRSRPTVPAPRRLSAVIRVLWWVSLPVALATAAAVGFVVEGPFTPDFTPAHLAYRILPLTCAAWAIGTAGLAVVIQVRAADGPDSAESRGDTPGMRVRFARPSDRT